MTLLVKDLHYNVLEALIKQPDICQNEINLLLHTLALIHGGMVEREDILDSFTKQNHLMQPVIFYLVNKVMKENEE